MTDAELRAEAEKLADYIKSLGSSFTILRATPSKHIGAIIADAVLQVGHRWKTHVEKRVVRIETHYPQAATLSGLSRLLTTVGAEELLDWKGKAVQERFGLTVSFFSNEEVDGEKIDTVNQLAKWLASDTNRDRLITTSRRTDRAGIPKIAAKTADYYRVMVGLPDAVAIDSLIAGFLRDAKVKGRSRYDNAKRIVQLAAPMLPAVENQGIRPVDLDISIWTFQSTGRAIETQRSYHTQEHLEPSGIPCLNNVQFETEARMRRVIPNSPLPAQGRAIVEAKNNDTWGTAGREIVIDGKWTACLFCWGGPLDLSTAQSKCRVSLSHKPGKRPYLWIPVGLWIGGTRYDAKLRYDLGGQGACISNPLDGGKDKLGHIMTGAGFTAGEKIYVRFIGHEAFVLKAP